MWTTSAVVVRLEDASLSLAAHGMPEVPVSEAEQCDVFFGVRTLGDSATLLESFRPERPMAQIELLAACDQVLLSRGLFHALAPLPERTQPCKNDPYKWASSSTICWPDLTGLLPLIYLALTLQLINNPNSPLHSAGRTGPYAPICIMRELHDFVVDPAQAAKRRELRIPDGLGWPIPEAYFAPTLWALVSQRQDNLVGFSNTSHNQARLPSVHFCLTALVSDRANRLVRPRSSSPPSLSS